MKTTEEIARRAMDSHYGIGTPWEHPNAFGEEGFTRAQAESDVDADEIIEIIEEAIAADRRQLSTALAAGKAVPGIRQYQQPDVQELIEAYENYNGDVEAFIFRWNEYLRGADFPCPTGPGNVHDVEDGHCRHCGDTRGW